MRNECAIEARRGYLELGGARLSYLEWPGEGPPALLLHGITSSAATLWRLGPAMAATGRRVVALDMPGHGESDVSRDHAIDAVAALAGGALEALGLRDVTLIGHSWGGATALALAGGGHPARGALARVALIDPVVGMSAERGAARLPDYLRDLGLPAATAAARIRAANPDWHPCDVHWKAEAVERCRQAQVAGFFTPPSPWDLLDRLPRVAAPLLILVADPRHTVLPPETLDMVRARLPGGARVEAIPGTTHNMLRGPGYEPTMAVLEGWLAVA